jgi:hypothetical protein
MQDFFHVQNFTSLIEKSSFAEELNIAKKFEDWTDVWVFVFTGTDAVIEW